MINYQKKKTRKAKKKKIKLQQMLLNVANAVKKNYNREKQTRAGDEPATIYITCSVCGHKWSMN